MKTRREREQEEAELKKSKFVVVTKKRMKREGKKEKIIQSENTKKDMREIHKGSLDREKQKEAAQALQ